MTGFYKSNSVFFKLPKPIQDFVSKHEMSLNNEEGVCPEYHDRVFSYMFKSAPLEFVVCGVENMKNDTRFTTAQREELLDIAGQLFIEHVPENNVKYKPGR